MRKGIHEVAFDLAMSTKIGFDVDRAKRIGASEIGLCARRIGLRKAGIAPDDGHLPTSGFAKRGDVMEDNWTAPLFRAWSKAHGGELLFSGQAEQVTLQGKTVPLSATPDGLAVKVARDIIKDWGVKDIGKSKSLVVEMKSIDPRVDDEKLPKPEHVPQTLVQMGMIRSSKEIPHKPDWGVVAYVDASDYFDIKLFPVQWNERAFKSLVSRADTLLTCKDPNTLAPEGKIRGMKECGQCEYVRQCLGFLPWVPGEDPRALKPAQVAIVEKAAAKLHKAKQELASAQQTVRDQEAETYEVINKVGRRFVMGTRFVVNAKQTASQNRDDVSAMKAWIRKKGGDPEGFKKQTKPGASLTVELRA